MSFVRISVLLLALGAGLTSCGTGDRTDPPEVQSDTTGSPSDTEDTCPSGELPDRLPADPLFVQPAQCDEFGRTMAGTPELVVINAEGSCGASPYGGVYAFGLPDLNPLLEFDAEPAQYRLGYEMALSDGEAAKVALAWEGNEPRGVLVIDVGGNTVAEITEATGSPGSGLAWSGDYLILGDSRADEGSGMLFVFDNPTGLGLSESDALVTHNSADDDGLGYWMDAVRDVDGDGLGDVVFSTSARVALLRSADLLVADGVEDAIRLNVSGMDRMSVGNVGDMDGDGLADIGMADRTNQVNMGEIAIFSSASSDAFARLYDPTGSAVEWGHGQGGIGDPDLDGREEMFVLAHGFPDGLNAPQMWQVEAPLCGMEEIAAVATEVPVTWSTPMYGTSTYVTNSAAAFMGTETDGSDPRVGFLFWD